MTSEAKRELARAYIETVRLHEASYDRDLSRGRGKNVYRLSWRQAATQACMDKDIVPLIYAMAAGGYSDYAAWAVEHAGAQLSVV